MKVAQGHLADFFQKFTNLSGYFLALGATYDDATGHRFTVDTFSNDGAPLRVPSCTHKVKNLKINFSNFILFWPTVRVPLSEWNVARRPSMPISS